MDTSVRVRLRLLVPMPAAVFSGPKVAFAAFPVTYLRDTQRTCGKQKARLLSSRPICYPTILK